MNIIRMTGGLGNQMFQYALYLKLKTLGRDVKLEDITEYEGRTARPLMLWVFDIVYPRATRQEIDRLTDGSMKPADRIRRKITGRKSLEYHEKDCNFDEQVLLRTPAYLTGYFQSEKYFKDIEQQVRKAFAFSDKIWDGLSGKTEKKIRDYLFQIENTRAVSVHIRRGDYLSNEEAYGGICTEGYYKNAILLMQKKFPDAVFFVFSNDMQWSKDRLWQWWEEAAASGKHAYETEFRDKFIFVEGTTEETGYLDMLLMSKCKHHIIANSSFSWWGAWLTPDVDKTVMAPPKWFGNQDCRDIYTPEMIKVLPDMEWN